MNLVLARTFLAIVECGNFNQAADRLHVTQSTVTMRVKQLESTIGQPLFKRSRTGSELTVAGVKFRRYAEMLVRVWAQAQQELSMPSEIMGVIDIGIHPDLWTQIGLLWLVNLRRDQPLVALSVHRGDSRTLHIRLGQGLLDAAIDYEPHARESARTRPLMSERLVMVTAKPRVRERWSKDYLYINWGDAFRRAHTLAFTDTHMPSVAIEGGRWALDMILAGGGSAYFPWSMVAEPVAAGRLHYITETIQFERDIYFIETDRLQDMAWYQAAIDALMSLAAAPRPEPPPAKELIKL